MSVHEPFAERRIVAVALLTKPELQGLGSAFDRAWPTDQVPCFAGLLEAIDDADRELWRERDARADART
jgi:hypothetical protein